MKRFVIVATGAAFLFMLPTYVTLTAANLGYARVVKAEDDCKPGTYAVKRIAGLGLVCFGE